MIEPFVLFLLALIIGILTFVLIKTGTPAARGRSKTAETTDEKRTRPCPLCGTLLKRGETVKTVVYTKKADTLAEVYGCPYCYGESATAVRTCPVCKKPVPENGCVIGRMFKEGRHLHVLGCTGCRKRR